MYCQVWVILEWEVFICVCLHKSYFWMMSGSPSPAIVVGNISIHTMPTFSEDGVGANVWGTLLEGVGGALSLPIRLVFIEGRQMRWAGQAVTETRVMTRAVCSCQTFLIVLNLLGCGGSLTLWGVGIEERVCVSVQISVCLCVYFSVDKSRFILFFQYIISLQKHIMYAHSP